MGVRRIEADTCLPEPDSQGNKASQKPIKGFVLTSSSASLEMRRQSDFSEEVRRIDYGCCLLRFCFGMYLRNSL